LIAAALLTVLLIFSCAPFSPTPDNEQILEAITSSNNIQTEPLELVYKEMQVPNRFPGKASAVIWTGDKSIQRNYIIAYDRKAKSFYVEDFITLWLGKDGVYRKKHAPYD